MYHYFNCVFLDLDNNKNITILHVFNAAVECLLQLKQVRGFHGEKKRFDPRFDTNCLDLVSKIKKKKKKN